MTKEVVEVHKGRILLVLPFPPSANRYWRKVKNLVIVSKPAREYMRAVRQIMLGKKHKTLGGKLSLTVNAHPPDKRKRDLDNMLKIMIDAMNRANVFIDDSQIDKIYIERKEQIKHGLMDVLIEEI